MDLALACFQARVLFINDIQPTATTNDLAMAITRFERFERTHNFHNLDPQINDHWSGHYIIYAEVSTSITPGQACPAILCLFF